jgi:hypothetical protein
MTAVAAVLTDTCTNVAAGDDHRAGQRHQHKRQRDQRRLRKERANAAAAGDREREIDGA